MKDIFNEGLWSKAKNRETEVTYRCVQTAMFLPDITLSWTALTLLLYKDVAQSHALWSLTTDTHRFPPKNVSPWSCANHEMLCCGNGHTVQEIGVSGIGGQSFVGKWKTHSRIPFHFYCGMSSYCFILNLFN